jgi:hypothetical protein
MDGWNAVGEPFRMLLNHNVPIPEAAFAIHGYSREYLKEHGRNPMTVYDAFRDYVGECPIVAHNLGYDWNRCLEPEWSRLGIPRIGQRGFCCMMLARRLVPETKSYRLDELKQCFRLTDSKSHNAKNDVITVVELFQRVYRLRLGVAGLDTFEAIAQFAKMTPVAKCLDLVQVGPGKSGDTSPPGNRWYFLDSEGDSRGPLPAREVLETAAATQFYVWREGMSDWVVNSECSEFIEMCEAPPSVPEQVRPVPASTKTMSELIGVCRGLIADNKITSAEVMFLNTWLQDAGFLDEWPASEIAQTLERILEDGVISKREKEELKELIQRVVG